MSSQSCDVWIHEMFFLEKREEKPPPPSTNINTGQYSRINEHNIYGESWKVHQLKQCIFNIMFLKNIDNHDSPQCPFVYYLWITMFFCECKSGFQLLFLLFRIQNFLFFRLVTTQDSRAQSTLLFDLLLEGGEIDSYFCHSH